MKKQYTIICIVFIIVGAGMFFAGMKYDAKKSAQVLQAKNQTTQPNPQQAQNPARPDTATGEVIAKDDVSFMVKMADESLKKVMFTDATTVRKTDTVSVSDVAVGQQVSVSGKSNEDGTLGAQNVAIRPAVQVAQ